MTDVGEMAEIRRELRENRLYVEDDELRDEISEWIQESHEKGDADTAREFVERRLNRMLAENEMYDSARLSRGEDGFPAKCSDCRHFGSACPVLMDDIEVSWRERKLAEADSEREARNVFQQQAIDVGCRVIPQLLEEWDNDHADFVARGQRLQTRLEEEILGSGEGRETLSSVDDLEAVTDGGETS